MNSLGILSRSVSLDEGEVTVGLSDLLLCLEMAIVSIFHSWIFSPKEHQHGFFELVDEDDVSKGVRAVEMGTSDAAKNMFGVRDVFVDIGQAADHMPRLGNNVAKGIANTVTRRPGDDQKQEEETIDTQVS